MIYFDFMLRGTPVTQSIGELILHDIGSLVNSIERIVRYNICPNHKVALLLMPPYLLRHVSAGQVYNSKLLVALREKEVVRARKIVNIWNYRYILWLQG